MAYVQRSIQGAGIGLRACHYNDIIEQRPNVPWFEALTDNYMRGDNALGYLIAVREHYPLVLHGVGLSLGSVDALNLNYLDGLKQLLAEIQPAWISDHLCWTSVQQHYLHDLLPLPYANEAISHVVDRIKRVQDKLGIQILIENVSSYFEFAHNEMPEWDFINTVAEQADCYILLDINNVYVNSFNHGFNAEMYLHNINPNRVKQFHLAGHQDKGDYLLDSHDNVVPDPVWALYAKALERFGQVPTLIEWDDHIPKFNVLQGEALKAQQMMDSVVHATLA